jgi:dTDP-4-amino-4,6-dideoxygalactose transaminase
MDLAHVESLGHAAHRRHHPVHLYGHPAIWTACFAIAAKHNLWVLEDCAQAQGAKYKGKRVGSMGDGGAYSASSRPRT